MVANLYTHKDANIRKTWFLMAAACVLVIGFGFLLSQVYRDPVILYAFVVFSIVSNIVAYWKSDAIALSLSGAQQLERAGNERLFRIVENLVITAGLPMPRLYVIPGSQINAFATGRNPEYAAVAVTQGALERLDDNELTGVLAHELSHIGNRDMLVSTVVVVLAGVISVASDWMMRWSTWGGSDREDRNAGPLKLVLVIVSAILAPLAATLIQLAVSRKREYLADVSGALLTRYPEGLASALEKIAHDSGSLPGASTATAHLFLANPFGDGSRSRQWLTNLFATHPPVEDRIRILRGMK
jgi:heat shock protein HtpX